MKRFFLNKNGFTIPELLVAAIISAVIIAGTFTLFFSQQKSFIIIDSQADKMQGTRQTVDRATRMLRQAGLDVISGQVLLSAKDDSVTFRGDVDSDVEVPLSEDALSGATLLRVDLNDGVQNIDATDFILIKNGDTRELVQVRNSGGDPVSMQGEPDTIYLAEPLINSYAAIGSEVRTVETVTLAHNPSTDHVELNGDVLAYNIPQLQFLYFDGANNRLLPTGTELSLADRTNVRRVELSLEVKSATGQGPNKQHDMTIDPRNLERPSRRNDVIPPAAPTGLTIVDDGVCGQFTVSYNPPSLSSDGSSLTDLAGYKIYFGEAAGDYYSPGFIEADQNATQTTVQDFRLTQGMTYHVAIAAYDESYNESVLSAEATFTLDDQTPPTEPIDIEATAGLDGVTLTWNTPEDVPDVYGYRIYRGTSEGTINPVPIADENTLSRKNLEFEDTEVDSCVTYYYKVAAVDCVNQGDFSETIFGDGDGSKEDQPSDNLTSTTPLESPPVPPASPIDVVATGATDKVQLSWLSPSDIDFAGVMVRWATGGYPLSPADGQELGIYENEPGEAVAAEHTGLINGQPYYYALFAFDNCENYSEGIFVSATPNTNGPVISIINPIDGDTVSDGNFIFQALAYDSDNPDLSDPPSFAADNGKGIMSMTFNANPGMSTGGLPNTTTTPDYCAFGGGAASSSCNAGDVSGWCDGQYNLYVTATDDEGITSQSPYVTINVQNGGLYLDETFARYASGAYRQEVNLQIENTAINEVTIGSLIAQWDRSYARLARIEIPSGSVIWQNVSSPATSGQEIEFDQFSRPSITAGQMVTAKFVFQHWFDTLSSSANAGDQQLSIDGSPLQFEAGETIWLDGSESVVIDSVSSSYIYLSTPLANSFSAGTIVTDVESVNDARMTGGNLQVTFDYQKDLLVDECRTAQYDISVIGGPDIVQAKQEKPVADTASTQTVGAFSVDNNTDVPTSVYVVDNSQQGIGSVTLYYFVDSAMGDVAPVSGYTPVSLSYSSSSERYEGQIPGAFDARIWYYFEAEDSAAQTARLPETGSFTYDVNSAAPPCPANATAARSGRWNIDLSWDEVAGVSHYNIHRAKKQGSTLLYETDYNNIGLTEFRDSTDVDTNNYCYEYTVKAIYPNGSESDSCTIVSAGDC